jgi:hypothetical protein
LDHAEYFRENEKPYRAAAIVAHLYNRNAPVDQWAHERGLTATIAPRASWYNPGGTIMVCYTRPGADVQWPPEMSGTNV